VSGGSECVNEVTYTNRRFWFVGLSHFQHSAENILLKFTGNIGLPYTQSLAKAVIYFNSVKTMNSAAEVE
jgi:hypothetical protein